jgi:selenium metabolism protein YedF
MARELDCRKQNCPQPIIDTKKALEQDLTQPIDVLVDSVVSRDNVRRFVQSQGHQVTIEDKGGNLFNLHIIPNPEAKKKPVGAAGVSTTGGFVVFITSDKLGDGEERLGGILMKAFLNTLHDSEPKPEKVMFMNNGVKLSVEGSDVLDSLNALAHDGVQIITCGTCLNYYGIVDKLKIGIVGNMYDILNSMLEASKVIKL